ncbi:MFS transporter [Caulobacter segnis]|uniref:Major facilitator superfamily MFS_1 n=2 Tax=Caulobacter segnis TaxID=88688 RepID=D5VLY9_CAUST|nr:MFS transporter [Caulobacter segnis]ADG11512.1 major facilitator superfamily MFS_1 [Caulobacter segnis ATCC 21756]
MARSVSNTIITPALCFLAALVEGYDLQSAGLAAPQLAKVYGLSPQMLGMVFSASTLGLLLGAVVCGRLSDLIGRKGLLVTALLTFGLFSIATALAPDVPSLLAMRFLTGLGLGGAFPVLIALVAASGDPRTQARRVTMVTAGMPLGGALAGMLVATQRGLDWATIFHVGGITPLVLAVVVAWAMREPTMPQNLDLAAPAPVRAASTRTVLFGGGRAVPTLALWISSFGTLVVLYLLLNWLPTLMISRGLARADALIAAAAFSGAGAMGTLVLGSLLSHQRRGGLLGGVYGGLALGLAVLAGGVIAPIAAAALAGFFVIGAQFVLYGLSAEPYPPSMKGTGAGASVAAGRLGAMAGPMIAGAVLTAGGTASQVLALLLPIAVVAFIATLPLSWRSRRASAVEASAGPG